MEVGWLVGAYLVVEVLVGHLGETLLQDADVLEGLLGRLDEELAKLLHDLDDHLAGSRGHAGVWLEDFVFSWLHKVASKHEGVLFAHVQFRSEQYLHFLD